MPVLGRLFESRSDNDSQTVLYIFLKPVIHREDRFAYLRYQSRQALEAADIPSDAPKLTMEPLK
jgi:type II secretory pathway component GspD/PulD (secretin)